MTSSTKEIILSVVRNDSTITPEQVRAGLAGFDGKSVHAYVNTTPMDRLLSRKEVAQLLAKSAKQVDALCRSGALARVYPKYSDGTRAKRACGISESSYRAFVESGKEA